MVAAGASPAGRWRWICDDGSGPGAEELTEVFACADGTDAAAARDSSPPLIWSCATVAGGFDRTCTRPHCPVSSLDLGALLLSLFPIAASAPVEEQRRHLARLICGAFTNRQASAAAKSLGFDFAVPGRATLRQLRLLCLEHIEQVFGDRKEIVRKHKNSPSSR